MGTERAKKEMFCNECREKTPHYIWKKSVEPKKNGKKKSYIVYFYCECSKCAHKSLKNLPAEKYNDFIRQKEEVLFAKIPKKDGVKREMYCKDCGDVNIHIIKFPQYNEEDNTIEFSKKCTYCDEKKQFGGGATYVRDKMPVSKWNEFIKAGN